MWLDSLFGSASRALKMKSISFESQNYLFLDPLDPKALFLKEHLMPTLREEEQPYRCSSQGNVNTLRESGCPCVVKSL